MTTPGAVGSDQQHRAPHAPVPNLDPADYEPPPYSSVLNSLTAPGPPSYQELFGSSAGNDTPSTPDQQRTFDDVFDQHLVDAVRDEAIERAEREFLQATVRVDAVRDEAIERAEREFLQATQPNPRH